MLCVRCSHPLPPGADRCVRCFALNPQNRPAAPKAVPTPPEGPADEPSFLESPISDPAIPRVRFSVESDPPPPSRASIESDPPPPLRASIDSGPPPERSSGDPGFELLPPSRTPPPPPSPREAALVELGDVELGNLDLTGPMPVLPEDPGTTLHFGEKVGPFWVEASQPRKVQAEVATKEMQAAAITEPPEVPEVPLEAAWRSRSEPPRFPTDPTVLRLDAPGGRSMSSDPTMLRLEQTRPLPSDPAMMLLDPVRPLPSAPRLAPVGPRLDPVASPSETRAPAEPRSEPPIPPTEPPEPSSFLSMTLDEEPPEPLHRKVGKPPAERTPWARTGPRLLAWTVDAAILSACAALHAVVAAEVIGTQRLAPPGFGSADYWLDLMSGPRLPALWGALFALLAVAYSWLFAAVGGRTPGMMLSGLRLRRVDGGRVSPGGALARAALSLLSAPALFGFAFALFDARGQALHDKFTGTVLVRDEAA